MRSKVPSMDEKLPHVLTPAEREIALGVLEGAGASLNEILARLVTHHDIRAVNRLIQVGVLAARPYTDRYVVTPEGVIAIDTPTPPKLSAAQRRTLERYEARGEALDQALLLWERPGRARARAWAMNHELAEKGCLDLATKLRACAITRTGRLALRRRFNDPR